MDLSAMYPSMPAPPAAAPANEVDAALASKFFPNSPAPQNAKPAATSPTPAATPVPAAQPPVPKTEAEQLAATGSRMFPSMNNEEKPIESNLPDAVRELREADPNRRMYSAQKTYASDLPDAVLETAVGKEGPDGKPFTQEQAVQAAGVWREIAADLELPATEVRELVPIFKAPPPTPEQQASNRSASMKWLVDQHGDRAGFALEAAQALVARDPRVAALLDHSGAGDDPRVVRKIVASALRQVSSGKLKVPKK